jgi:hypothetical protein
MELVNRSSPMVMAEELNIFSTAPTITPVVEWVKISPVFPIASLNDSQIIELYIPGSPYEFIQLSRMKLVCEGKITKADGTTAIAVGTGGTDLKKIGFCPNILYSQFNNVEVSLQEKVVQHSNNLYHLQTHVQQLINHDRQTMKSELPMQCFFLDDAGAYDELDEAKNSAVKQRNKLMKDSATMHMVGPLMISLCEQIKLLVPNVSVRIKFMRNDQKHILLTDTGSEDAYKYTLTSVKLLVPKVRLKTEAGLGVEKTLLRSEAAYQFTRYQNSYISIPKDTSSAVFEGIYSGMKSTYYSISLCHKTFQVFQGVT